MSTVYEAQMPGSSSILSVKAARMVQVKSIEVEFKKHNGKFYFPVFILFQIGNEKPHKSNDLTREKNIHWDFEKQLTIESTFTISIFVHNFFNDTNLGSIHGSGDELYMKPLVLFDGGKKVTVKIECEAAGALVDLVRRLVNEAQNQLGSKKAFLENLRKVCEAMNYVIGITDAIAEAHPAVKAVVTVVSSLCDFCNKVQECHEAATKLMEHIATYLPFTVIPVDRLKEEMTGNAVQEMLELFEKIARSMIDYSTGSILGKFPDDRIKEIRGLKEEFVKLKETFSWCVQMEIWKTTLKIEANTDAMLLRLLGPATEAFYKVEKGCLEGSRKDTLQAIEAWSETESGPKLLWLHGAPGFGKTTLAHTIARSFDDQRRLAGCFFVDKNNKNCRNPVKIMPTIAYQLAKWHADYHSNIISLLQGRDERRTHSGLSGQFELLMKTALDTPADRSPPLHKPLVIVLDGLEGCDDPSDSRHSLAYFIIQIATVVPWLKVFVSSRKSPKLGAFERDNVEQLDISEPFRDLHHDVATLARLWGRDWKLSSDRSEQFENDIEGLFHRISASMGMMDIANFEAFALERTNAITKGQMMESFIVSVSRGMAYMPAHGGSTRSTVKDVLAEVSCISMHRPITEEGFLDFLHPLYPEITAEELRAIVSLNTVIENKGTIGPKVQIAKMASPILEFLADSGRSGPFHTEVTVVRYRLAERCLKVLVARLKFNICDLESSYLRDKELPGLASRITENISEALQYSSLYCMDHILQANGVQNLRGPLLDLLCTPRALYWIEVLSFIGALEKGKELLRKCGERFKDDDHIANAAMELHKFISKFSDAIKTSTPHVYVSALTWTPPGSFVRSVCQGALRIPSTLACEEAGDLRPRTSSLEETIVQFSRLTDGLRDAERITISRDRSKIASGHHDRTVQIWDAHTGELIRGPLKGHTDDINDIIFSPDDRRIVTASWDHTLRIWDAQTGNSVAELKGVYAVVYSPDGKRIVSGSGDWTVRIWDAQTGDPIGKLLKGHKDTVYCVGYSPDGSRIVSGSDDKTLRIWDAQSGAPLGAQLKGHEDSVLCVAYSPDGRRIVSGSLDYTLRIWDTQRGSPVGEPMKGHKDYVRSVTYSPDGSRIISGSWDGTVRIWDAQSGAAISVAPRDESRWDSDTGCFLSIPSWWPKRLAPTTQALIHSDAPLYIPEDGWLRTLDGGLFIWVPPKHRRDVCCSGPMGKIDPALRFEWKKVLHGKDWTKIMDAGRGSEDH